MPVYLMSVLHTSTATFSAALIETAPLHNLAVGLNLQFVAAATALNKLPNSMRIERNVIERYRKNRAGGI